jgi:hypothetical protein
MFSLSLGAGRVKETDITGKQLFYRYLNITHHGSEYTFRASLAHRGTLSILATRARWHRVWPVPPWNPEKEIDGSCRVLLLLALALALAVAPVIFALCECALFAQEFGSQLKSPAKPR